MEAIAMLSQLLDDFFFLEKYHFETFSVQAKLKWCIFLGKKLFSVMQSRFWKYDNTSGT